MPKKERILDPIHGLVEFDRRDEFEAMCWQLMTTAQFQRLRRVKQLGFSELVFPGASHSRLAHSVGVFHTARRLASVIKNLRPVAFDQPRAHVAVAAALLHDLGHGPFSHAFESVVKRIGVERHEATSVRIIRESPVAEILNEFMPGMARKVATVIDNKVPEDLHAAIVSSQFDADRLDYMQRDRLMTGYKSSAIDFEWLVANLEIRRVRIGQDEAEVNQIETLVVGPKATLAAEAYVLGLFHLYPTIYYHKTTRSAEKLCGALLYQIFRHSREGSIGHHGLPNDFPLVRFARDPNDLSAFQMLDDNCVFAAASMLTASDDGCLRELSTRLVERRLYKAIDVTSRIEASLTGLDFEKREEAHKLKAATIRERMAESGLLEDGDGSIPRALEDVVSRDPYRRNQGDDAALDVIYAIDRSGEVTELSRVSKVVAALKKFEAYRIYYREEDEETKSQLDMIIREAA